MNADTVFEINADRYEAWFERHPAAYTSEIKAVREVIKGSEGRVVEIGLGTGRFAAPLGITEGIEPSAAMRSLAKARGIYAAPGVAEGLPYGTGSVDGALMVTTICFVDDPATACREAFRILKPGGRFVVGLVDRDSFLGEYYEANREQSVFYRYARFFGVREVNELLSAAGFTNMDVRQTLFHHPADMIEPDPVLPGHGQGGFAVIATTKPTKQDAQ